MPIAFYQYDQVGGTAATASDSITIPATLINPIVIALLYSHDATVQATGTYDSVTMNQLTWLRHQGTEQSVHVLYLTNMNRGTKTIQLNWTGSGEFSLLTCVYTGVHPVTPIRAGSVTTEDAVQATADLDVPSLATDMIVDAHHRIEQFNNPGEYTLVPGGGQTNIHTPGAGMQLTYRTEYNATYKLATGGPTTTMTQTGSRGYAYVGFALRPATGGRAIIMS